MVDTRRMRRMALQRVLRGGYTAIGAVASGATGNFLSDRIDNDIAVDLAQVAVGATASIGVAGFTGPGQALDEDGFISEAVEFAGYGIQAAGWDELFEDLDIGISTGTGSQRVVDVRSRASKVRESQSQSQSQTGDSGSREVEFSADVG